MQFSSVEKQRVPENFDEVAPTYDLLTTLNPGYHRHLRLSAERLEVRPEARILDLCCGTGASTEALVSVHPRARIEGLDASAGMLVAARKKPILRGIPFLQGDATDPRTHGANGLYDGILMAYGIRNVPDPDRCLSNLLSLLSPGGTVCFHEYSVRDSRRATLLWDAVAWGIIIPSGVLTAPRSPIYRYLHRSVRDFDGVRAFASRLSRAGFVDVETLPMDGWQRGILHTFRARRPR
jgi:ubiquinone/menaquinone biosynthesis C-methylase UbiE